MLDTRARTAASLVGSGVTAAGEPAAEGVDEGALDGQGVGLLPLLVRQGSQQAVREQREDEKQHSGIAALGS